MIKENTWNALCSCGSGKEYKHCCYPQHLNEPEDKAGVVGLLENTSLKTASSDEKVRFLQRLHQYYRDCLSRLFGFPSIGSIPDEVGERVVELTSIDILQFTE